MKKQIGVSALLSLVLMVMAGCFSTGGSSSSPTGGGGSSTSATSATGPGIREGQYECWAFSSARMMLNFRITSGSSYTGHDGNTGSYSYDPGSGRLTFKSGFLAGAVPDGYHWLYHSPGGRPTASLRNAGNTEVSFCQWMRK